MEKKINQNLTLEENGIEDGGKIIILYKEE